MSYVINLTAEEFAAACNTLQLPLQDSGTIEYMGCTFEYAYSRNAVKGSPCGMGTLIIQVKDRPFFVTDAMIKGYFDNLFKR